MNFNIWFLVYIKQQVIFWSRSINSTATDLGNDCVIWW